MHAYFQKIDSILCQYRQLWHIEPYHLSREPSSSWFPSHPDLCAWLDHLSVEQIEKYQKNGSVFIEEMSTVLPEVGQFIELTSIERCSQPEMLLSQNLQAGIPGRKLEQIKSMGAYALEHHNGQEWLEWCSGKGYLGRILSAQSRDRVVSFEWQESLCVSGQTEADQKALNMQFVQGDALANSSSRLLRRNQHAVALHACGDLHVKLMQYAAAAKTEALTISPCCYHLIENDGYQPLSQLAKHSRLTMSKSMLKIPLQETVTGGTRVIRHRQQEMTYRLGLDSLMREACDHEDYYSIPSIKKSLLSHGFKHFCQWAADKKQFSLPDVDYNHWQKVGLQRFWKMERINLVQQLFRRQLEIWLVLDRALYLQDHGYEVSVTEFCRKEVTPRNILIHAQRKSQK